MRRVVQVWCVLVVVALVAGCGGDDGDSSAASSSSTSTSTAAAAEPLRIVVSNDDGIASPGIDLLVQGLRGLDDVEVTVVAPADNQSATGDRSTPGGAPYEPGETASGIEGTAVDGFPADTVNVALDELGLQPHLFVSGVNEGHNIGPLATISGTVGVALTAIRRGVPAIAASAGLDFDEAEFQVAVDLVLEWITEHREELLAGTVGTDEAVSINVPVCPPDEMGELVEVPLADAFPEGQSPFESSCDLSVADPADDFEALTTGYPTLSEVPADLEPAG